MTESVQQDLAGRIEALEIKSAFQEDLIESLNAVVVRQQDEIRRMEHEFRRLQDSFEDLSNNDTAVVDTPPPHY